MKLLGKIVVHALIIFIVMLAPPLLYDALSSKESIGPGKYAWVSYVLGIVGYFSYIIYWLVKIENIRVKTILIYLAIWIAAVAVAFLLSSYVSAYSSLMVPLLVLVCALMHALAGNDTYSKKTLLYVFFILLVLTLAFLAFSLYGLASSPIANMRY
jgi:hypothetical protein